MKTIAIKSTLILFLGVLTMSCSNDDDSTPVPVNEEEIITTMTILLTPQGGGQPLTLQSRDLDGDGPNPPAVTVSGDLTANTVYSGSIVLLNETENPPENITTEVIAEADEHQFLFVISGGLDLAVTYDDFDGNGDPLGTQFAADVGNGSTGTLTVILRHEPNKPNDGTPQDAGGETDISVTFNITVQ